MDLALEKGAKRALLLPVSAPFHSPLMQPAALEMHEALGNTAICESTTPIISNVTTKPVKKSSEIKTLLVEQITGRVRWRESMATLQDLSVTHAIEIGSGKVLTGLVKRIDPALTASSISTIADLDAFIQLLDS